jgi:hypothetical protein
MQRCVSGACQQEQHSKCVYALLGFNLCPHTAGDVSLPQAQGESQIRKSLEELRAWSLQRSLVFAVPGQCSSSTASGQQQPVLQLVREWDEALVEVGNHQSLTANLKASPHHAVFRVRRHVLAVLKL